MAQWDALALLAQGWKYPGLRAWHGGPRGQACPCMISWVFSWDYPTFNVTLAPPQEACLPLQQGTPASEKVSSDQTADVG